MRVDTPSQVGMVTNAGVPAESWHRCGVVPLHLVCPTVQAGGGGGGGGAFITQVPFVQVVPAPQVCVITVAPWQRVAVVPTQAAMLLSTLPRVLQRCGVVPLHVAALGVQIWVVTHSPPWQLRPAPQAASWN